MLPMPDLLASPKLVMMGLCYKQQAVDHQAAGCELLSPATPELQDPNKGPNPCCTQCMMYIQCCAYCNLQHTFILSMPGAKDVVKKRKHKGCRVKSSNLYRSHVESAYVHMLEAALQPSAQKGEASVLSLHSHITAAPCTPAGTPSPRSSSLLW